MFKSGTGGDEMNIKWKRYRFKTYAEDYRPLIFNTNYPWWCSGTGWDDDDNEYSYIIVFLPQDEDLLKYWDDAFDIEFEEVNEITFTSRFSRPKWYTGEAQNERNA